MLRLLCVSAVFCVHWSILDFCTEGLQYIMGVFCEIIPEHPSISILHDWWITWMVGFKEWRGFFEACASHYALQNKKTCSQWYGNTIPKERILSKFPPDDPTLISFCTLHYLKNPNLQVCKEICSLFLGEEISYSLFNLL